MQMQYLNLTKILKISIGRGMQTLAMMKNMGFGTTGEVVGRQIGKLLVELQQVL